ncbi:MAG: hypothetical protein H7Y06_09230 [Opitutaceae bacterium]|nr:hypothetical protein [Opitutaceae bacterium]
MITRPSLLLALCCLFLVGCATRSPKSSTTSSAAEKDKSAATTAPVGPVTPGPVQILGRVIAVDQRTLSVIVQLGPYAELPFDFTTRQLIARRDDLQPTARLQSSSYLRGRTLGTRLIAGKPQIGDEVVFLPVAP